MRIRTWRRRGLAISCVIAALAGSAVITSSASAAATITFRGTAVCNSGRPVVGVWLASSGGGAGWANWAPMPGRPNVAWYTRTFTFSTSATTVEPRIGCGNTPASWASTSIPPAKTVSTDYIYNVWCNDPASGTGRGCYAGALPSGGSTNRFAAGNCTWGAAELWRKATGQYPSWGGNAKDWATNAGNLGFRISSVPHARSVIVFPAYVGGTGAFGHVAWVTRVWVSGGAVFMHLREMNWGALGVWRERDIAYDSRFRFIVAPPGLPVNS
jgi:surface antigen